MISFEYIFLNYIIINNSKDIIWFHKTIGNCYLYYMIVPFIDDKNEDSIVADGSGSYLKSPEIYGGGLCSTVDVWRLI